MMTPATKYAYERLWKLNDHADLQLYGPDLLIQDVETVVAALASAERQLAEVQADAAQLRETIAHYQADVTNNYLLMSLYQEQRDMWREESQHNAKDAAQLRALIKHYTTAPELEERLRGWDVLCRIGAQEQN